MAERTTEYDFGAFEIKRAADFLSKPFSPSFIGRGPRPSHIQRGGIFGEKFYRSGKLTRMKKSNIRLRGRHLAHRKVLVPRSRYPFLLGRFSSREAQKRVFHKLKGKKLPWQHFGQTWFLARRLSRRFLRYARKPAGKKDWVTPRKRQYFHFSMLWFVKLDVFLGGQF